MKKTKSKIFLWIIPALTVAICAPGNGGSLIVKNAEAAAEAVVQSEDDQQYQEQTKVVAQLTVDKQKAEEKVALASQLDAAAITVIGHNKRGKEEKKSKNVTQFVVNFTIVKNITVQTGEKTVYLRIVKPNEEVLGKDTGYTCKYENVVLECSERKMIEYTGEQQEVTMYVDVAEFLSAGTYTAYLFVEGVMIGEQSVTLN